MAKREKVLHAKGERTVTRELPKRNTEKFSKDQNLFKKQKKPPPFTNEKRKPGGEQNCDSGSETP